MKKTNNFTLAALAVLSLAGCTQDDERAAGLPMTGMPLRVVAHVDAPVTREAMTTETLDHYYFRVTDQDGATTPEYDHFVEMTKGEDGQWKSDTEMTWGTAYPKVSAWEQKGTEWIKDNYTGGSPVNVGIYQSTREYLLESDLLYMPPTDITAANLDADGNIKVNLKHRFAKLNIVVNITGTPSNPINELTIGGTKPQANFTPKTNTLGVYGYAEDITAYCASSTTNDTDDPSCTATYECILIPQELTANTLKVTATLGEDTKSYTHDKALTLEENCQYTLTLNMNHQGILKPSGDVNVGNWGDKGEIGEGELEEGAEIKDGTYYVSTARGLLEWAKAVQDDNDLNLTLTADIDMEGRSWPIIQGYIGGIIDGQGYTISNLTLTEETEVPHFGFITSGSYCTIQDLTLLNPDAVTLSSKAMGYFIGGSASSVTMKNCHVIGASITSGYQGGLAQSATKSNFIACSVTSSNLNLIDSDKGNNTFTACYVIGGGLARINETSGPTVTASYYLNNDAITSAADGSTVDSWSEAMTAMNQALSDNSYEYQWVENPDKEDTERPLVIKTQTTN